MLIPRLPRILSLLASALVCASASHAEAATGLTVSWTNNLLTVTSPNLPGGRLDIWYLEAFCRSGSTQRDWRQTVFPHKTSLLSASRDGRRLRFLTRVTPAVEVLHEVQVRKDELVFEFKLTNQGSEPVDLNWFQPACIRVDRFTGRNQSNYIEHSFIFTQRGLTTLAQTKRTEDALYRGGQVYVPQGIPLDDVNPRPLSGDQPANGLIGCFSADGQWLMATAWDRTHELFEGVYVCLHADPHVGGLGPGESKKIHGRLYLMKNDVDTLLKRYKRDFKH